MRQKNKGDGRRVTNLLITSLCTNFLHSKEYICISRINNQEPFALELSSANTQPRIIDWTEKHSAEALGFALTRQNLKSLSFRGRVPTG